MPTSRQDSRAPRRRGSRAALPPCPRECGDPSSSPRNPATPSRRSYSLSSFRRKPESRGATRTTLPLPCPRECVDPSSPPFPTFHPERGAAVESRRPPHLLFLPLLVAAKAGTHSLPSLNTLPSIVYSPSVIPTKNLSSCHDTGAGIQH